MCFLVDVKNNTAQELLMFNQCILIKVSDMLSVERKKSILVPGVEENPIYVELTVFCYCFSTIQTRKLACLHDKQFFGFFALKIFQLLLCLFSSFSLCFQKNVEMCFQ